MTKSQIKIILQRFMKVGNEHFCYDYGNQYLFSNGYYGFILNDRVDTPVNTNAFIKRRETAIDVFQGYEGNSKSVLVCPNEIDEFVKGIKAMAKSKKIPKAVAFEQNPFVLTYEGEEFGFNAQYLLDILEMLGECEVFLDTPKTPLFVANSKGEKAVLCPIRVPKQ